MNADKAIQKNELASKPNNKAKSLAIERLHYALG